mmetsp:Transcript_26963/g.86630  ORF Transcript_26963/g.86630 Transcript_26963/m.86630 type:complete len:213 (-) Transcript_26963:289-927(-)
MSASDPPSMYSRTTEICESTGRKKAPKKVTRPSHGSASIRMRISFISCPRFSLSSMLMFLSATKRFVRRSTPFITTLLAPLPSVPNVVTSSIEMLWNNCVAGDCATECALGVELFCTPRVLILYSPDARSSSSVPLSEILYDACEAPREPVLRSKPVHKGTRPRARRAKGSSLSWSRDGVALRGPCRKPPARPPRARTQVSAPAWAASLRQT